MARRATYFFDVYKPESPTILVSGGFEYARPGGSKAPSTLLALSKAYDRMGYDVGYLTEEEAALFEEHELSHPAWQQSADQQAFTIVETSQGDKIGFLRFPALKKGAAVPSPQQVKALTRKIKAHRDEVKLIVGLSPWGWVPERDYLNKLDPEVVPDILLGSGPGAGINGRILADGRSIWIRSYDSGRSIVQIQIMKWPDRQNPFAWQATKNYTSESIGLNDQYKDNPEVEAIFQ